MNPFALAQPTTLAAAQELSLDRRFRLPIFKAGGLDLLDHLKEGILEPDLLININQLRSAQFTDHLIRTANNHATAAPRITVEAVTTLAELAASPLLNQQAPALAQAAEDAATPQIRNVATTAGNLLQRPRCWYYRNQQFNCLKKGGHHCFAVEGENKFHAIFSPGPCHIVHPSNLAPALHILNATIHLHSRERETIPISELFRNPDEQIRTEHQLRNAEIITHLTFDTAPASAFYAVKEQQSADWPLVMAAVALDLSTNKSVITNARICAGAVAPTPYPLPNVEKALVGLNPADEQAIKKACALANKAAQPLTQNAYKTKLLPVAVHRAIRKAAGLKVEELSQ